MFMVKLLICINLLNCQIADRDWRYFNREECRSIAQAYTEKIIRQYPGFFLRGGMVIAYCVEVPSESI